MCALTWCNDLFLLSSFSSSFSSSFPIFLQIIRNGAKLKRMSKKQLKHVKKMQVDKHGVVEIVSPWGEAGRQAGKASKGKGKKKR